MYPTEIIINDDTKLSQIKKDFNKRFPYLKLEFFTKPHKVLEPSPRELLIEKDCAIGEIQAKNRSGRINVSGMMTVKELEQKFHDLYGVSIQVFRQSGSVWIQTTVTDNWTLTEQNNRAYEYARKAAEKNKKKDDFQEQL